MVNLCYERLRRPLFHTRRAGASLKLAFVNSPSIPPAAPGDSEPVSPSLPGVALWSDSDSGGRPPTPGFEGLVATEADRAMPTIGHIGRYALKYQLGTGGLGTVFAAHDPLLSRLIAVKTLNVEIKDEERESFNALFLNEARAAGGLSHPHIVTVFDAGISDNRAYIAMELLKGRDLRQLRQEGWRATPAQAALIIRRVADALAFAHSKGVIHRDIKPANIFMVGRTQPRVLDFGIARVAHRQGSGDAMLGAGSPYYMAPEQVRREPGDRRADVFSLGVVLYELLTDQKPFRGETLKEITTAVLTHEPELACKIDPAVPKTLADIAARAMAKDPEQRFRSARSFARELRQWLDANPSAPDPEATLPTVQPLRRRVPAIAATALVAVALLAAGLWWKNSTPVLAATAATPALVARTEAALAAPPARVVASTAAAPTVGAMAMALPASGSAAAIVLAGSTSMPLATPPMTPTTSLAQPGATPSTPAPAMTAAASIISKEDSLLLATIVPTPPRLIAAPAPASSKPETAAPTKATLPMATAPVAAKESAKDRRAREARERETKLAMASVAPATGTVKIAISPWGMVEVDGAPSGAAPPLTELTLAEGKHQIVVRNGEYPPYVASVNVIAGQVVALRYKFGS